jgi:hypothetical protein
MKLSTLTIISLSCAGTLIAIAVMPVNSPEIVTAQQQLERPLEQPPVNSTTQRNDS